MLARKVALNTIVSLVGRILGTVLALIIFAMLTRYLGVNGFGEYVTIMAYLQVFNIFTDLGLYSIAVRDISRDGADEGKILGNAFSLRFFVGIFVFIIGALIVSRLPQYSQNVKLGFIVGAFGFWAMTNNTLFISIFQKNLRMDKVAIGEVLARTVQLAAVFAFIRYQFSFLYFVVAMVLGAMANFGFVYFSSKKFIKVSLRFDFVYWKKLLKESIPLGLAVIFCFIYFKLDTVMLSLMKPVADVGVYGVAYRVLESLIFFPHIFIGIVMPLFSRYVFDEREKFKVIFTKSLEILLLAVIPLIIGTMFLSTNVVRLIGGDNFLAAGPVLNILIIATGIIFLGTLFSQVIISFNQQKYLAYIYGFGSVFNVVTNLIFIPRYSYYGAAGTTVATEFLVTIIMMIVIYRELRYIPSVLSTIFRALSASGVMAIFLYYWGNSNFLFALLGAVIIYFTAIILVGGIKKEEIKLLISKS